MLFFLDSLPSTVCHPGSRLQAVTMLQGTGCPEPRAGQVLRAAGQECFHTPISGSAQLQQKKNYKIKGACWGQKLRQAQQNTRQGFLAALPRHTHPCQRMVAHRKTSEGQWGSGRGSLLANTEAAPCCLAEHRRREQNGTATLSGTS